MSSSRRAKCPSKYPLRERSTNKTNSINRNEGIRSLKVVITKVVDSDVDSEGEALASLKRSSQKFKSNYVDENSENETLASVKRSSQRFKSDYSDENVENESLAKLKYSLQKSKSKHSDENSENETLENLKRSSKKLESDDSDENSENENLINLSDNLQLKSNSKYSLRNKKTRENKVAIVVNNKTPVNVNRKTRASYSSNKKVVNKLSTSSEDERECNDNTGSTHSVKTSLNSKKHSKEEKCDSDSGDDSDSAKGKTSSNSVEETYKEHDEHSSREAREIKPLIRDEKDIVAGIEVEEQGVIQARVLTSHALDGQSIYGFVTPKRKDALAKIAQEVIDSAKSSRKSSGGKRSAKRTTVPGKSKDETHDDAKELESKNRRMKNRTTLALTLAANDSDDSYDGETEDSEDDDEESDDDFVERKKSRKDNRELLDEYFEVHSKAKALTSDKTLAKLTNPKMDQKELLKHLREMQSTHIDETLRLHCLYHGHFKRWIFQLLSGFNLLLYGFGSKRTLLEKFRKEMLTDKVHIVVNGFFPSIQLKHILKIITDDILERETSFKNTIEHYKYIKAIYDSGAVGELYIIIHNIDGHILRSQNTQTALGCLASSYNIHIIATIDHINAPLMWDQNRASAFNWLWYDATTFESYSEETSYENSLMVQQSGTLALSSLKHVLHSLTSNAKGIFRLLADHHLDNEDNTSYQGIAFADFYQRCREKFLVNSDLTLRAQLTEFKDHKLVSVKRGHDGIEYLSVALDCATLRMFIDETDT